MSTNKNALLRYQILDRCFRDPYHKYTIDDLVDKVNCTYKELFNTQISLRQIRSDIQFMRDSASYNAPIVALPLNGRKCFYRYDDKDFSIFTCNITQQEVVALQSFIKLLQRYRGLPNYAWLEDAISNLEVRFGVKPHAEQVVSFEQNDLLKGREFLGDLIDAALNHQPLSVVYQPFDGAEATTIIHPYYIKQFNNRWFLIGLQEGKKGNYLTNKALDRIVGFKPANVPFIPNKDIDFNAYFADVVGVTIPEDHPSLETVLLKFDQERFPYVVNKPIHPSQEVYSQEDCMIKLCVRPNKELEARIFSYGCQVEVIAPIWLRNQITEKLKILLQKYTAVQVDCSVIV